MTLPDDLLLLALNPRTGGMPPRQRLVAALSAAELLDLALAGRVQLTERGGRIDVLDPTPVEDRRLSGTLRRLTEAEPMPDLHGWLRRAWRSLAAEYLSRLEDQGVVRVVRRSRGGQRLERPRVNLRDRDRRQALRRRVVAAVNGSGTDDPSASALACLIEAAGLTPRIFPGPWQAPLRRRLRHHARTLPAAQEIRASAAITPSALGDAILDAFPATHYDAAWDLGHHLGGDGGTHIP